MTAAPTHPTHRLKQPISKRLPGRRNDSGLTTLEWLLIVAAVAALAALAVVLVQNVVGDTSEQIAGSSARKTAAIVAAQQIMQDATRAGTDQPDAANTYSEWLTFYRSRCDRLKITYGDAGITVNAYFQTSGGTLPAIAAGAVKTGDVSAVAASVTNAADVALAHCTVR